MKLLSLSLAILSVLSPLSPSRPTLPEESIPPSVQFYDGSRVKAMSVEDYVTGVVLHEMPYTFHKEALRAQAVAARTYMYYCLNNNSHPHENGAEVCSDIFHCCGYTTKSALAERFGDSYAESALDAVTEAVHSTEGEVMTYNGEEILAVWHSSSADSTEDSGEVWMCQLPYLTAVSTPEAAKTETVTFQLTKVKNMLSSAFYSYNGSLDISVTENKSGRCAILKIGNITFTGNKARSFFSLKSTNFDVWRQGGKLYFRTRGYGHGVGLSQCGAEKMARDGAGYENILTHYYKGASLSK